MTNQSLLAQMLANPYFVVFTFLLTLIGAWSGIKRIISFSREYGGRALIWSFRKTLSKSIEDVARSAVKTNGEMSDIVGIYFTYMAAMTFKLSTFIANSLVAFFFIETNLLGDPAYQNYSLLGVPFFAWAFMNIIEISMIRFRIHALKAAMPLVRKAFEDSGPPA